jgi:hypothetical protein
MRETNSITLALLLDKSESMTMTKPQAPSQVNPGSLLLKNSFCQMVVCLMVQLWILKDIFGGLVSWAPRYSGSILKQANVKEKFL